MVEGVAWVAGVAGVAGEALTKPASLWVVPWRRSLPQRNACSSHGATTVTGECVRARVVVEESACTHGSVSVFGE